MPTHTSVTQGVDQAIASSLMKVMFDTHTAAAIPFQSRISRFASASDHDPLCGDPILDDAPPDRL
jgi:hypothetical protein